MLQTNESALALNFSVFSDTSMIRDVPFSKYPVFLDDSKWYFQTVSTAETTDSWSLLDATSRKHVLEGIDDYVQGRYKEFDTIDELIKELNAQSKENE